MIIERIRAARSRLLLQQPFFGVLALNLKLVIDPSESTISTDGCALFFNDNKWINSLTDAEMIGAVAHEVVHVALKHHFRRGNRDLTLWNRAADYVTNPIVLKAGLKLPEGVLYDPQYEGMGVEEVYDRLLAALPPMVEEESELQQQGGGASEDSEEEGEDGDGAGEGDDTSGEGADTSGEGDDMSGEGDDMSGEGAGAEGAEAEEPGDPAEGEGSSEPGGSSREGKKQGQGSPGNGSPTGENDPDETQAQGDPKPHAPDSPASPRTSPKNPAQTWGSVRDAPAEAKEPELDTLLQAAVNAGLAAGALPDCVQRVVAEVKQERVDWRDVIQRFVDDKNDTDYSWSRPNRRLIGSSIIMPSAVNNGVRKFGVVIDTSRSIIDENALGLFLGQLQAMFDLNIISELIVICCDAYVGSTQTFSKGDDIKSELKVVGGGGTRFSPALQWFADNEPDVSAVVYFTDLICYDFGPKPDYPVLWAVWGFKSSYDYYSKTLPFGEAVHIADG